MTTKELNRDIKRLVKNIHNLMGKDFDAYFEYIHNDAKKEFIRLYYADKEFKYMNKQSVLIMFRLNISYRFVEFHRFGSHIEIF